MSIQNISTERFYTQYPKTPVKPAKEASKNSKVSDSVSFCGMNALAEYNKPFVQQKEGAWWKLPKEKLEEIKDEIFFVDEWPDDDTLSFVLSTIYDLDAKNLHRELNGLGVAFEKLEELGSEKKEKLFNSDFISFMTSATKDKALKLSCFDIPAQKLDELDILIKDDLIKKFLAEFLNENIKKHLDANDSLEIFEKYYGAVVDFSKRPDSDEFYDLLLDRNYRDINGIATILNKRMDGLSKKERNELHSLIQTLLDAKTPNGAYVFSNGGASDTTNKALLDGIENILDAKENNPQKFAQLMKLLELTKDGTIPPHVLGILPKKAEINEDFLAQIRHPKKDIVEKDGKIFYQNGKKLTPLKMDKKTFEELFPPLETIALGQGALGDCYLISSIFDFLKNPDTKGQIYSMFEQNGDEITVTIPDAKEFPVKFSKKDFARNQKEQVGASLGIQMLEMAYSKTRSQKYGTTNKITAIEGGMQKCLQCIFK